MIYANRDGQWLLTSPMRPVRNWYEVFLLGVAFILPVVVSEVSRNKYKKHYIKEGSDCTSEEKFCSHFSHVTRYCYGVYLTFFVGYLGLGAMGNYLFSEKSSKPSWLPWYYWGLEALCILSLIVTVVLLTPIIRTAYRHVQGEFYPDRVYQEQQESWKNSFVIFSDDERDEPEKLAKGSERSPMYLLGMAMVVFISVIILFSLAYAFHDLSFFYRQASTHTEWKPRENGLHSLAMNHDGNEREAGNKKGLITDHSSGDGTDEVSPATMNHGEDSVVCENIEFPKYREPEWKDPVSDEAIPSVHLDFDSNDNLANEAGDRTNIESILNRISNGRTEPTRLGVIEIIAYTTEEGTIEGNRRVASQRIKKAIELISDAMSDAMSDASTLSRRFQISADAEIFGCNEETESGGCQRVLIRFHPKNPMEPIRNSLSSALQELESWHGQALDRLMKCFNTTVENRVKENAKKVDGEIKRLNQAFNQNHPPSFLDFIYFATYTITTTGYGDIQPRSSMSKFISTMANIYELIFIVIFINLLVSHTGRAATGRFSSTASGRENGNPGDHDSVEPDSREDSEQSRERE